MTRALRGDSQGHVARLLAKLNASSRLDAVPGLPAPARSDVRPGQDLQRSGPGPVARRPGPMAVLCRGAC